MEGAPEEKSIKGKRKGGRKGGRAVSPLLRLKPLLQLLIQGFELREVGVGLLEAFRAGQPAFQVLVLRETGSLHC